jgi:hypothetical protein
MSNQPFPPARTTSLPDDKSGNVGGPSQGGQSRSLRANQALAAITNPQVIYVVMVKRPNSETFVPCWGEWSLSAHGVHAKGFANKIDAGKQCQEFRIRYGKKNAYVQQYGPYA